MNPSTIVELSDVSGKPKARMSLPSPMRVGDRIQLRYRLTRQTGGRDEVLDVNGEFRVQTVSFDASSGTPRQILSVSSTDVSPSWKAVKKTSGLARKLGPARMPPMSVE